MHQEIIAVTYDVFLCAFLAEVLSWKELQTEAKKLLQDGNGKYDESLETILGDYYTQETEEELCGVFYFTEVNSPYQI